MIRIISGKHRGRRFLAPNTMPVRPTTDRAKEALFNILNNDLYFDELKCLDLFSGTGNISYELISRGSKDVTAVDQNAACIKFIHESAEKIGEEINIIKSDVFKFLKRDFASYDLIFADPPYDFQEHKELVDSIFANNKLKEDGNLIVEHSAMEDLSSIANFIEARAYGSVKFSFFKLDSQD